MQSMLQNHWALPSSQRLCAGALPTGGTNSRRRRRRLRNRGTRRFIWLLWRAIRVYVLGLERYGERHGMPFRMSYVISQKNRIMSRLGWIIRHHRIYCNNTIRRTQALLLYLSDEGNYPSNSTCGLMRAVIAHLLLISGERMPA